MGRLIRSFFLEYVNRLVQFGPSSLPSSFSIVEAFLTFSSSVQLLDMRTEVEHILSLHQYLDWYTGDPNALTRAPNILIDAMQEGVAYCYNFVNPPKDFTLNVSGSTITILGITMIRHGGELSLILSIGQNPPHPPFSAEAVGQTDPIRGREMIRPRSDLTAEHRLVEEGSNFGHVLALARIDLTSRTLLVRTLMIDQGPSYMILTDDPENIEDLPRPYREHSIAALDEYRDVFSALRRNPTSARIGGGFEGEHVVA